MEGLFLPDGSSDAAVKSSSGIKIMNDNDSPKYHGLWTCKGAKKKPNTFWGSPPVSGIGSRAFWTDLSTWAPSQDFPARGGALLRRVSEFQGLHPFR